MDDVETDRTDSATASASRRTLLKRGGVVAGIAGLGGGVRTGSTTRDQPQPAVIGHRGCAAEHPENTIAAVEAAATIVDAVEVDVRRCSTGELVAFHDETLDRLTTERGHVDRTPCETVLDLEIEASGETIPALRDVFEAVPPETGLVLDLKESGLATDVLALSDDHDHDLLLSSFRPAILEEVRAADPTVSTAHIVRESIVNRPLRIGIPGLPSWVYAPEDVAGLIETTVALGCDAIHPRYELCLQTDLVPRAQAVDLRVEPWTIASERAFEALWEVGVDSVISDVCTGLAE